LGKHRRVFTQPDFIRSVLIAGSGEILHFIKTRCIVQPSSMYMLGRDLHKY
jgi:hypothetical protein